MNREIDERQTGEQGMSPEALQIMRENPDSLTSDVYIQTDRKTDVSDIKEQLEKAGVSVSVRRLGKSATKLISRGRAYEMPGAVRVYLKDREVLG
jgi:hypothetical protein